MALFEARHYKAIAAILLTSRYQDPLRADPWAQGYQEAIDDMRDNFVVAFQKDNPSFKPTRFREACGIE